MEIDFREALVCVIGPPGSGKSNWLKWILQRDGFDRHLIWDPMREHDPNRLNVLRPPPASRYRRYEAGNDELNKTVDEILSWPPRMRPEYLIIDEANRVLPNGRPPGEAVQDLIDFNRHYEPGIGVWFVSRRPAQINSDAENLSKYHIVFGYQGRNDRAAYADIHEDLPDRLREKEPYQPVVVGPSGEIETFRACPDLGETRTI